MKKKVRGHILIGDEQPNNSHKLAVSISLSLSIFLDCRTLNGADVGNSTERKRAVLLF